MKTAIVLSDTHGNRRIVEKLFPLFEENDYIIHLGDGNRDMSEIYRAFPDKTFVCNGNCDFETPYSQSEWEIEIEEVKILACHGHKYRVKSSTGLLKREALSRGCAVALYGHTHRAEVDESDGLTVMNPGNGQRYSSDPSYGYLVINGKQVTATTVPVNLE